MYALTTIMLRCINDAVLSMQLTCFKPLLLETE